VGVISGIVFIMVAVVVCMYRKGQTIEEVLKEHEENREKHE
jgi:uncharacterized protein (DUF433 family)